METAMHRRMFIKLCAAAPLASALVALPAVAASYPQSTIKLVMGYAAGGTADLSWRIVAPLLAERLKQAIVIDNRPGAGGIVASQAALNAPADGYTLLMAASGNFGISPVLMKSLPFDTVKDFDMIAQAASFGYAFAVSGKSAFHKIQDVIDFAKQNPGKLSIGTVQVGSAQFFAAELFKSMAGISAVTVPYRSSGDVVAAARSGDVQLIIDTLAPVVPHMADGALRVLGVSTAQPFPALPQIPTIASSGLDGYVVEAWNGLAARAGTPPEVVERINRELADILTMESVKKRFLDLGIVAQYGDAKTVRALQLADIKKWGDVMVSAKIEKL
ncbi:Bug family tripartite tricarboxylate transporter substrate binding protein [Bordetella holmesii]